MEPTNEVNYNVVIPLTLAFLALTSWIFGKLADPYGNKHAKRQELSRKEVHLQAKKSVWTFGILVVIALVLFVLSLHRQGITNASWAAIAIMVQVGFIAYCLYMLLTSFMRLRKGKRED